MSNANKQKSFSLVTGVLLILPLILLGVVILVFLNTGGGLDLEIPAPIEDLTIERTILDQGTIDIILRNTGPEDITIAQVVVNEGVRPFTISPSSTISRLDTATLHLDYGWVHSADCPSEIRPVQCIRNSDSSPETKTRSPLLPAQWPQPRQFRLSAAFFSTSTLRRPE